MTIYNIHPNSGDLERVKGVLTSYRIGLTHRMAQQVIDDVRELQSKGMIKSIKRIVNYINKGLPHKTIYYKPVKHWNNGTRYI